MKVLIAALIMILLSVSPALAHWEDPRGCDAAVEEMGSLSWTDTFSGLSDDGRDYIIKKESTAGLIKIEEHHMVLPKSQWEAPDKPAFYEPTLSAWIDRDGDGRYEEFFLFPRGQGYCGDAMHFVWDGKDQTYKLLQTGKDHI